MTTSIPALVAAFAERYPKNPTPLICRAPGRTNIIGEHVDYCGLPVLPMAVDRDIVLAMTPRHDSVVHLEDLDPAFAPVEFENGHDIPASPAGSWENYTKAAVQGLNKHFGIETHPGMDMLVASDIPVAAGLSSSSALVVASALAYLPAIEKQLDEDLSRLELATLMAESEHYVGTKGGGMDQAIILLGQAGAACKIDFNPLHVEPVPLLDSHTFVVCNSLVKAEKTGDMLHRYNEGPVSCRLLRALVEKQAQRAFDDELTLGSLGELWFGLLCLTNVEVAELMAGALPTEHTTLAEAAVTLGTDVKTIRERWIGDLPEPTEGFPLQARARHLLSEYSRVEAARDALLANDPAALGILMNDSHASCAGDYLVSCPELDALVSVARDGGALGARLTGAGFGGCTVNLVLADAVNAFREHVHNHYYETYLGLTTEAIPEDAVIDVRPTAGAGYCPTA
jgi:N-acetylgalactosamine kinase